jgi:hydroxymethylbilane synthase
VASDSRASIRVGTRGSLLALWQADQVIDRLRAIDPTLVLERQVIGTVGDRVLDQPLARIGDKGLFTHELEEALRAGTIDLAVHSLKDLPTGMPPGLAIAAVLEREDPRDVVISTGGFTLATLPAGAVVGTSSLRRRAQVLAARPDLSIRDLRGNVPTRIAKVDRGEYDAAIMAYAGVWRLSMTGRVSDIIPVEVVLPAVGQGAMAIETPADDPRLSPLMRRLDHQPTRLSTTAERSLLAELEGGCQVPIGALATFEGPAMTLRAVVADLDGRSVVRAQATAEVNDGAAAGALGRQLAARLIERGAGDVLARVRARGAV